MSHIDQTMAGGNYGWDEKLKCWTRGTDEGTEVVRVYGLIIAGGLWEDYADTIRRAFPETLPPPPIPVMRTP